MINTVEGKTQDQPPEPRTSLSRQAYDNLLYRIVNLEISPGDILVEASVAEELGTSRAPVREALKTLTTQGFLRVLPRTGYMVVPVTADDLVEILHLRLLMEGEAAFMAAGRVSDTQVQEIFDALDSRLQEIEQLNSSEELSLMQLYDENTNFHTGVARAAGSRRLASTIGRLLDEDRRVLLSGLRRRRNDIDASFVIRDHTDLLSVIRTGDSERARSAMHQHIEQGRIRLVSG